MSVRSRLSCEEAFRRLDDYLDRALEPGEIHLVEEHLADCVQCAREFEFEETLLAEVRIRLRRLDVPKSLAERLRARLEEVTGPTPSGES